MERPSDFINTLYDFTFKEFVTLKIIRIVFAIGLLIAGILTLIFIIYGFSSSFFLGLFHLLLAPFIFVIQSIIVRVGLEITIVLFNISEYVRDIAKSKSVK